MTLVCCPVRGAPPGPKFSLLPSGDQVQLPKVLMDCFSLFSLMVIDPCNSCECECMRTRMHGCVRTGH